MLRGIKVDHKLNLKQVLKTTIQSTPWSLVILFLFTCFVAYVVPKVNNRDIQYLQSLLINAGAIFAFLCAPIYFLAVKPFGKHFSFIQPIRLIVQIACIFLFGYSILGLFGDQLLSYFAHNPNLQLPFAIVLFVFFAAISRFSNSISYALNTVDTNSSLPYAMVSTVNKFSQFDLDRVAAHEAGHLALSFTYGKLPEEFKAQIYINGSESGAAGMVTGINSPDVVSDPLFDSWRMHVLLAGQIAEKYIHDLKTNGSSSDFEKWQLLAKQHLENQHDGIYYVTPANDLELHHNNNKLDELRASQSASIVKFLELNHASFIKMYEELKEKKKLDRKEIIELFSGMQHLDELPYPNGKFESFSKI